MKRDVAAAVAIGVAVLVMVVAIVMAVAGPARAEDKPDLYLRTAEIECQEALAAMENRDWGQVIGQLTVPGEVRSSMSMHIAPVPEGQAPRAVKPQDVLLAHAFRTGGDSVVFENMTGGGRCVARCHNMIIRGGEMRPEWVIEAVSLAGVGEARRGPDVVVSRR